MPHPNLKRWWFEWEERPNANAVLSPNLVLVIETDLPLDPIDPGFDSSELDDVSTTARTDAARGRPNVVIYATRIVPAGRYL